MLKKIALSIAALTFSFSAFGQDNIFTDAGFSQENFKLASKDLVSAFAHTTNSGGSSLGSLWGVEAGVVFGALDADNLTKAAKSVSNDVPDEFKYIPYAGIVAGVALPFGIGGELSFVPKTSVGDGSFANQSIGLRWAITDMVPLVGSWSPLKITARAAFGSADFKSSFSATGGSTETVDFELKNTEFGVTAGFNFFLVEPYLGLSTVKSSSDLAATSDISLPGINPNARFSADLSGARTILGVLLKLPLLRIGLEMSNMQSTTRYTAKISLKI